MPARNGTGPIGQGSRSGRGLGACSKGAATQTTEESARRGTGLQAGNGQGLFCRRTHEGGPVADEIFRLENILAGFKRGRGGRNRS